MVSQNQFDVVVVGAGFSGLYALHRLREAGFSVRVYERGGGVGGTWYWNRYPGARCDVESTYYNYTFSEEIFKEWNWTQRYPEHQEIRSYLNYVAEKLRLYRDIQFDTAIESATYNEETNKWNIQMDNGETVSTHYFITAVGAISTTNVPNFRGLDQFKGEWYHTGNWPHEEVSFSGKHVGIIGTGSSGVQAIPVIAEQAKHLTIFQRTPAYSVPANNYPLSPEYFESKKKDYKKMREGLRKTPAGLFVELAKESAMDDSPEVQKEVFEKAWTIGGNNFFTDTYQDIGTNKESNKAAQEFIRNKIREAVKDPDIAEKLMPTYYYGMKRPIIDTNYFETFNRDNVSLVDVKIDPIQEITANGVKTKDNEYPVDTLVFATGFDGMTGSLFNMNIRGRNNISLKEKWDNGAETRTYLGLATAGFPNMFMITGPESPSVLSNVPIAIEQHVEWIGDFIEYLRDNDIDTIEAKEESEKAWSKHCNELYEGTLYAETDSWYTGANIEGKKGGFQIYVGGIHTYQKKIDEVTANDYEGFSLYRNKQYIADKS